MEIINISLSILSDISKDIINNIITISMSLLLFGFFAVLYYEIKYGYHFLRKLYSALNNESHLFNEGA